MAKQPDTVLVGGKPVSVTTRAGRAVSRAANKQQAKLTACDNVLTGHGPTTVYGVFGQRAHGGR